MTARRAAVGTLLLFVLAGCGGTATPRAELTGGTYPPARTLAQAISGAPQSGIPELQALVAVLPS